MPELAIYADTQTDPKYVYEWLNWLDKHLPFPIIRVSVGNLGIRATTLRTSKKGNLYGEYSVPAYVAGGKKPGRMLPRHCTPGFKVKPVQKEMRRIRNGRSVVQWLGISVDEASRMKPSNVNWIDNRWPLIEESMSRQDCLAWMETHGYPKPPRSACVFCPYHHDDDWRRLQLESPEDFIAAINFDHKNREAILRRTNGGIAAYVHKSLKPLDEVDFSLPKSGTVNAFNNECTGICNT